MPDTPAGLSVQAGEAPRTSAYARKATGMVREIRLLDMFSFNLSAPGGIGIALLIGLFYGFVAFAGGNLVLALAIGLLLAGFIWLRFALVASAFPQAGGDYVFGSRALHPIVGLASNIGTFLERTEEAASFYVGWTAPTLSTGGSWLRRPSRTDRGGEA